MLIQIEQSNNPSAIVDPLNLHILTHVLKECCGIYIHNYNENDKFYRFFYRLVIFIVFVFRCGSRIITIILYNKYKMFFSTQTLTHTICDCLFTY